MNEGLVNIEKVGVGLMGASPGTYGPGIEVQQLQNLLVAAVDVEADLNGKAIMLDTADIYGKAVGENERLLGEALHASALPRNFFFIATKCGFQPDFTLNFTPDYIRDACQSSLERLKTSIDLFYLHRMPERKSWDACLETLAQLFCKGKFRYVGLSEPSVEFILYTYTFFERKRREEPGLYPYNLLAAVETEFSIFSPGPALPNPRYSPPYNEKSLLQVCSELGITFVAYAPFSRGLLTLLTKEKIQKPSEGDLRAVVLPRFKKEMLDENLELQRGLTQIAQTQNISLVQLALGWCLTKGKESNCNIVVIPGTTKPERVKENLAASSLVLHSEVMGEVAKIVPHGAYGDRYPEFFRVQVPDSPVNSPRGQQHQQLIGTLTLELNRVDLLELTPQ